MTSSRAIRAALQTAVDDGVFPGAVLAARLRGEIRYLASAGRLSTEPPGPPVQNSTIYDLASLTKPLATVTSILLLVQQGKLDLNDPLRQALDELQGAPVGHATVRDLLTHRSGLPGWRPLYERLDGQGNDLEGPGDGQSVRRNTLRLIRDEPLIYVRGERSLYSDLGFILLGLLIERIVGMPLDRWFDEQIAMPLQAHSLGYRPEARASKSSNNLSRIAPTEYDERRKRMLQGEVHDDNAAAMGGVAGHAGLFGTAESVLAVSGAWLEAYHDRSSILDGELVRQFTSRQSYGDQSSWALGWDTPSVPSSSGSCFSDRSFGHLGYTGTSLWVDPLCELEVVLLSNRVHPSRKNEKIKQFRPHIHDIVYRACVLEDE